MECTSQDIRQTTRDDFIVDEAEAKSIARKNNCYILSGFSSCWLSYIGRQVTDLLRLSLCFPWQDIAFEAVLERRPQLNGY